MTKIELAKALARTEQELGEARKHIAMLDSALSDVMNAEEMLRAFAGQLDCVAQHYPSEESRVSAQGHLIAIAKGWFGSHPVSSADQISRACRKLLQAAHEEAWLYRAQEREIAAAPPVDEEPTKEA